MRRRVLGVVFSAALIFAAFFYIRGILEDIFNENISSLEIDGFMTVFSIYALFAMGIGIMAMSLFASLKWIDKNSYAIAIVSIAVAFPLSGWTLYELKNKTAGFTECKDLRQSSRRHSSKTYAITPLECQRLVSEREARRS